MGNKLLFLLPNQCLSRLPDGMTNSEQVLLHRVIGEEVHQPSVRMIKQPVRFPRIAQWNIDDSHNHRGAIMTPFIDDETNIEWITRMLISLALFILAVTAESEIMVLSCDHIDTLSNRSLYL